MRKPLLSNYPALHQLLRNNPQANTEFNAILGILNSPGAAVDREKEYEAGLEAERTRAYEYEARSKKAEAHLKKASRFIQVIGEVLESQLKLNPYVQDVSEKSSYDIRFNPVQVRMALRWYWDLLGDRMEAALSEAADPLDEEGA